MSAPQQSLANRHLKFGWWTLFLFVSLGVFLEALHGFKIGWYLNVSNESRRLMLTLAHAHGTLLALIHIAVGATIGGLIQPSKLWKRAASPALIASSFLLPGGFLLGGVWILDGDPGVGIFLVPIGGFTLLFGILVTAMQTSRANGES